MTERARAIGMTKTIFRNASGLPNPAQRSTARDMTTLGMRLQDDFPGYYRYFSTPSFTFQGKTYKSHNTLMRGFPGMDGIKTGYTRASGFNLVSSVRADGKHLVGAVFGGKTAATRNALMRSLLFTALPKASSQKTRDGSPQLIAQARPAEPQAAEAADASWSAKTKKAAADKKPAKPAVKVAKADPTPAAAAAPAPSPAKRPKGDAIASILSDEGDAPYTSAGEGAAGQPAAIEAPASPRLDLQALREAMQEPVPGNETATAALPAAEPPKDIASLIRNSIVEGTPDAPAQAVPVSESHAVAPVARPPSTLQSQANALTAFSAQATAGETARTAPSLGPPPSRLKGPMPPPQFAAAPVGIGYEIQIGAYGSAAEAQGKLDLVRDQAVGLLNGHGGVILPVQRDERQIFRSRFVHFDENGASNACLELRRLAIDCFVMKAD
jgi:D-alanyl-D-alanine carboxypeptidase